MGPRERPFLSLTDPGAFLKSNLSGFSLIELVIVVGIVGILAAVALPAYNSSNYTAKAKYTEMLMAMAPIKSALSTCAQSGDCLSGGNWGALVGSGTSLALQNGAGAKVALPLPLSSTKVIDASLTSVAGGGSSTLTVTLAPLANASNGLKPSDTLSLSGVISTVDGSVQYTIGGGCKTHTGGALC